MIGDKFETDILLGKNARIKTACVLTGVENRDTITQREIQPDFIWENLEILT